MICSCYIIYNKRLSCTSWIKISSTDSENINLAWCHRDMSRMHCSSSTATATESWYTAACRVLQTTIYDFCINTTATCRALVTVPLCRVTTIASKAVEPQSRVINNRYILCIYKFYSHK